MERGKRWEIKNMIEKVAMERKLKYMLSDDNNAPFGKYVTSLCSPSDILDHTKLWARSQIYGEQFSDNGQIYDWNKEKNEYLEIWKI